MEAKVSAAREAAEDARREREAEQQYPKPRPKSSTNTRAATACNRSRDIFGDEDLKPKKTGSKGSRPRRTKKEIDDEMAARIERCMSNDYGLKNKKPS